MFDDCSRKGLKLNIRPALEFQRQLMTPSKQNEYVAPEQQVGNDLLKKPHTPKHSGYNRVPQQK